MNIQTLIEQGWVQQPDGTFQKGHRLTATSERPAPDMRIRQSSKPKNNKLESAFETLASVLWPSMKLRSKPLTFLMANGVRYTPDFIGTDAGRWVAFEVKGKHAWDDSLVKLKVAASLWPELEWQLWWRDGEWKHQIVLP